MTAFNTFRFFGYQLRPAGRKDLPLAVQWDDLDEDHHGRVDPQFWVEQGPGEEAYVLEDQEGPDKNTVLFFLKLCGQGMHNGLRVVELHIQFDPGVDGKARARRRHALMEGLQWLERTLRLSGGKEIFFRSRNEGLILFAQKRLGFVIDPVRSDGEAVLRRHIANPASQGAGATCAVPPEHRLS